MTDYLELMRYERNKALIKALAELDIARHTYYNDFDKFIKLESIIADLKQFKEDELK